MANSLQDQMLRAGLVTEQQLKQTKTKKRKKKRSGTDKSSAEGRQQAATVAADKRRRDAELNRQRDADLKRKAEEIALWQLVRDNRIIRRGGDVAYNFTDAKALKRLYVTGAQQQDIVAGKFAIVRHNDFYELVPAAVAERLAARDAAMVPVLIRVSDKPEAEAKAKAEADDDEYADYKVPDDLMW